MTTSRITHILAVCVLSASLGLASKVHAAEFTVDDSTDAVSAAADGTCDAPGADTCTLREAILEANATVGDDTIHLPEGHYQLTIVGTNEDANADGDLDITATAPGEVITIVGAGAVGTLIDGNGAVVGDRVFDVDPTDTGASLVLQGVTVYNGEENGPGGGIRLSGRGFLRFLDSVLTQNEADTNDGGGLYVDSDNSTFLIENSTISENVGDNGAGIAAPALLGGIIADSVIKGNEAALNGGGIYVDGSGFQVLNTKIEDNTATVEGGGLYVGNSNVPAVLLRGDGEGSCSVTGNSAVGGGGIYNTALLAVELCRVADNRSVSAGAGGGVYNDGDLHVVQTVIENNEAENEGGGIYNSKFVRLERASISGNTADSDNDGGGGGGGVYNDGHLWVTRSVVTNNQTNSVGGGGIYDSEYAIIETSIIADNTAHGFNNSNGSGGGIYYSGGQPFTLRNSTISGNQALGDDGSVDSEGGGLWLEEGADITNTTIVGNRATGNGGGVFVENGTTVLNNVTIALNTADVDESGGLSGGDGGGFHNNTDGNEGETTFVNTIIADNTDASPGAESPDCTSDFTGGAASLESLGPNFVGNLAGCEVLGRTDLVLTGDPLFDPAGLADNGGETPTLTLQAGSPALDAGNNELCLPDDQRGTERPQDGNGDGDARCDLGAVEVEAGGAATTGGDTTGGDTTGGTTGGSADSGGGCSLEGKGGESMSTMGLWAIAAGVAVLAFGRKRKGLLAALLGIGSLVASSDARAATFTVDAASCGAAPTIADGEPGSLRFYVNNGVLDDDDVIEIPAECTVVLTSNLGDADADEDLDIRKSITIRGAGAGSSIVDANGAVTAHRAFEVDPDDTAPHVTFEGITVTGGLIADNGGGILLSNHGQATLLNSVVDGNETTTGDGGGVQLEDEGTSLTVIESTISNNKADGDGGGINGDFGGSLLIFNSIIEGNKAGSAGGSGSGGGLTGRNSGFGGVEIVGSRIINNAAGDIGGQGGGVYNNGSAFTIRNTEISGNSAPADDGGGIRNNFETMLLDNVLVQNNEALGDNNGGGISNKGILTVLNSTIDGNRATGDGGGLYNDGSSGTGAVIYIDRSTVSGNIADFDANAAGGDGGGIFNENNGGLSLTNSAVTGNTSKASNGGGISNDGTAYLDGVVIADNMNELGDGGGFYDNGSDSVVLIRNTTVSGNKALVGDGGGLALIEQMDLSNVTVVGNEAGGNGGGVLAGDWGNFNNVTIALNTAAAEGGGLYLLHGTFLNNSVVAGNTDTSGATSPDCASTAAVPLTSGAGNLIGDDTGCVILGDTVSVIRNVNASFDAAGLSDNGGPSVGDPENAVVLQTLALGEDSPALDAANDTTCFDVDARGVARPQGDACDSGAFELEVGGETTGDTTGGDTTGGETTGGSTTGGDEDSGGGCSLIR